ncbi:MAG: hypothetical protein R6U70_01895 [Bacillota bacterium]
MLLNRNWDDYVSAARVVVWPLVISVALLTRFFCEEEGHSRRAVA